MHRILRNLLAAAFAAFPLCLASAQGTTDLTVRVNDGANNLAGVKVVAVNFGMNGPSTYTVTGLTDADGLITLALANNMNYNLYTSLQGFSPTLRDQFNNPDPSVQRWFWPAGTPLSSTITLTADVVDAGRIELGFVHATPDKVLFGSVNNNGMQGMGYTGIVQVDGTGAGTLVVDNVPYAEANTYNIGLYDPEKNRGVGRSVMTELSAGTPLISYTGVSGVDFDNSIPPTKIENTASQNNEGGSNLSVEGMVRSTETVNWTAIPHNGVNFQSCAGGAWAKVDENGRFQLYNLRSGVTYYVEAYGGCTWSQSGPGDCYEPYRSPAITANQDLCTGAAPKGANDFVYLGGLQAVNIRLNKVPRSTGQIKVYVRSSAGFGLPNGGVNIHPDGTPWSLNGCSGPQDWNTARPNPGFSNANINLSATGYALLDGLPSGNYMLNVWTPFSKNSDNGPSPVNDAAGDGFSWDWQSAHCTGTGVDDIRISVDTTTTPSLQVFDNQGNNLNLSSITVIVQTNLNMSGLIRGTVKFDRIADLSANPMTITANPNCGSGGCSGMGNMTVLDGSGSDHYDYELSVSSGSAYYLSVNVRNWGRVRTGGGDDTIHLESTGTVTVDMSFTPAGTITGTLYKPDGSVFTPANNQWIWVDAGTNNGWAGAQLQKDGSFTIEGALPGVNRLKVNESGSSNSTWQYALPSPQPSVTVTANRTSTIDLNLVNAAYVGIGLNPARVPDPTVIMTGYDTLLGFKVLTLPAGSLLKGETLSKMLTKGEDEQLQFKYSGVTGPSQYGPCGQNWNPAGFCAAQVPTPALYDFYLMRSGDFGNPSVGPSEGRPYPHFVLLSAVKNVVIDQAHSTSSVRLPSWGPPATSSGVLVNMTPAADLSARGNATLYGQVAADNFFRQADYDATGGDFENFISYLPVVALYDENGAFGAAGIVVPPPSFIAEYDQDFNLAFAQGYPQFKALLDLSPYFGFEIRGLAPNACYTAVVTTPNYPPYQRKVCLGADKSTTTVTVSLDQAVGAGATLRGVVTDTNSVVLANAAVEISGESIDNRTVVTSSAGIYKFEGLAEGAIKIKVSLDGYAAAIADKNVSGTALFTQDFSLALAGGSITGTVYSQKMPFAKVQPGALIFAYDDTFNGENPTAPLALLKTRTGSDGTYTLTGLVPEHYYKVFLKVPGKYVLTQSTKAVQGVVSGIDFTMLAKPLDIEIFAKRTADAFEFTVLNPQDFKTGAAYWCEAPFVSTSASTPLNLDRLSSGELRGTIPLSSLTSGETYVLHGEAVSLSNKRVVRELLFGLGYKGNANQAIDNVIIGDDSDDGTGRRSNEAPLDKSGDDPSALLVPPGVMLPISTGAIPTCLFKALGLDDPNALGMVDALGLGAFAGNLYTLSLSSVSLNPDKGFELILSYDKDGSDLEDLAIARYNEATGEWEIVAGVITINALKGTVKVKLSSLSGVSSTSGFGPSFSEFNGKEYVVRPRSTVAGTSGTFAVIKPSLAGNAYSGTKVKVFNFPNPFNLRSKTTAPAQGVGSQTTTGTTIHVEVPAANGGPGHIRIYTASGELVRDIAADFTAGTHNYVNWDGRNKSGAEVANGVYFGVVELTGKKPGKGTTFKMAVIK